MSLDEQKNEVSSPAAEIDGGAEENRFSSFDIPTRPEEKKKKHGKSGKDGKSGKRMNSRLRTLLIAVGGMALLALILVLVLVLAQSEEPASSGSASTDEISYTLIKEGYATDIGGMTELTVTNPSDRYTIQYDTTQKVYRLKGYEELTLGATTISDITSPMMVLNASDKLAMEGTSLADFGLDKPAVTAEAAYDTGNRHTVYIGNATPSKGGYYVRVDEDSQVYICSKESLSPFFNEGRMLVSTTLLAEPVSNADDSNAIAVLRSLELSGKKHPTPLSIHRLEKADSTELSYTSYMLKKPYERGVAETVSTSLSSFNSIVAAEATVLHPTDAQLKEYGLKDPTTVAKITVAVESTPESESSSDDEITTKIYYNNSTVTLTLGNQTDDGYYYGTISGIHAIFKLSASYLSTIIDRTYENTVNTMLFLKNIQLVDHVDFSLNGEKHTFTLTHDTEEEDSDKSLIVREGTKNYSTADFRTLYQLMMGISRYQDEKTSQPAGEAELSFAVHLTDGTQLIGVNFYPVTGSLYCAVTAEGEVFTVKSSVVRNFTAQYQNYLNGKTVLDY